MIRLGWTSDWRRTAHRDPIIREKRSALLLGGDFASGMGTTAAALSDRLLSETRIAAAACCSDWQAAFRDLYETERGILTSAAPAGPCDGLCSCSPTGCLALLSASARDSAA